MSRRYRHPPISLHTPVPVENSDNAEPLDEAIKYYAGSPDWRQRFYRYMEHVLPKEIAEVRRVWHEWWTDPYVVERLRHYMGDERAAVAIAVASHQSSYHDLAKEHRHSVQWVEKQRRIALRLVRALWLQYELPRRNAESTTEQIKSGLPKPVGQAS